MRKISLIFLTAFLTFIPAHAQLILPQYEASGAAELESYSEAAKKLDPEFSYDTAARELLGGGGTNPVGVAEKALNFLLSGLKENIGLCMSILLISLCLSAFSAFVPETEKIFDTAFYVCYAVIFILGIKSLENGIVIATEALDTMRFFMNAAIPVLGGMLAVSGGVSGCVLIGGSIIAITGIMGMFSGILLPLCRISAVLCGVNNLSPDFSLKGLASALQKAVLWCLGIIMIIFTGIPAVQSFAAVGLDSVAGKTVRYITGNAVPIVGGVLSDTLGHIIACSKTVKSAAGGAAMLAMLYICLAPVLEIAALIITYRLSLIIISPVADRRISGVIEDFVPILKIALSLVICSGIMFIIFIGIMTGM